MADSNRLKVTPLHDWHVSAGANMADFGGFDMPLWYPAGVKTEHLAVLKSAGLFDTSHMSTIMVFGDDAFEVINYCFTRDIQPLLAGRCAYGAFLTQNGHCIDDAIVYKFNDHLFMICVNAGMGQTIAAHLNDHSTDKALEIHDLSGQLAKIDIQGKNAAKILSNFLKSPDTVFSNMPYFSFKGMFNPKEFSMDLPELDKHTQVLLKDGTPMLLSRSGYTGEFGFEIFIQTDAVVSLWSALLQIDSPYSIEACGLGARDSLRAGACLPLSHQDIGDWKFINHPWEFALPYTRSLDAFIKPFLGDTALTACSNEPYTYAFAGDSLRKVGTGPSTRVIDDSGNDIGSVLTCATDMGITWNEDQIVSINTKDLDSSLKIKGISCGFIRVAHPLEVRTRLTLVEGKRKIKVQTIEDIRPDRTARKKISAFV